MAPVEKSQSTTEYLLLMSMVVSAIWLFCKPGGPLLNNVLPNLFNDTGAIVDYPPITIPPTLTSPGFKGANLPGPWNPFDDSWNSGQPGGWVFPNTPPSGWVNPNTPPPGWISPPPPPTNAPCPGCPPPPPGPGCPGCPKPGFQGQLEKEEPSNLIVTAVPQKFMTDTLSDHDSIDPSEDFALIKDPSAAKDANKSQKNLKLTSGHK